MFKQRLADLLLGCKFTEQVAYFIEENEIWRDTVRHCRRCEKVSLHTQRQISAAEFWEDDSAYQVPFTSAPELKLEDFKSKFETGTTWEP